jgi:hypothetical protein
MGWWTFRVLLQLTPLCLQASLKAACKYSLPFNVVMNNALHFQIISYWTNSTQFLMGI